MGKIWGKSSNGMSEAGDEKGWDVLQVPPQIGLGPPTAGLGLRDGWGEGSPALREHWLGCRGMHCVSGSFSVVPLEPV